MPCKDAKEGADDGLELSALTGSALDSNYFDLRWRVLRQPWNQPRGSERDNLDATAFHLVIRTSEGKPLAIGRLHLNSPAEAQVRFMAVDPAWRNLGLGGRILRGLQDEARARRVARIVLNAREDASEFYLAHGYQVEGPGETLFDKVRHVRMRKNL
jgi:predicted GNAT family N-acyltransferase